MGKQTGNLEQVSEWDKRSGIQLGTMQTSTEKGECDGGGAVNCNLGDSL